MDPDANLAEQRKLAADLVDDYVDENETFRDKAERLAELVQALDGWITKGGFLPAAWQSTPAAPLPAKKKRIRYPHVFTRVSPGNGCDWCGRHIAPGRTEWVQVRFVDGPEGIYCRRQCLRENC